MKTVPMLFIAVILSTQGYSQRSQVLPWSPSDEDLGVVVYCPEPLLFVHGINANDGDWSTDVIPALNPHLQEYFMFASAIALTGDFEEFRAHQEPHLHTHNYGDMRSQNTLNRRSFEHIEWNAWDLDKLLTDFPSIYSGQIDEAPADDRTTLDVRIRDIRNAYRPPGATVSPNVVIVAHSQGGLLSHYYLLKSTYPILTDHGVRRLVTLATPHQGTHFANWVLWYKQASPAQTWVGGMWPAWHLKPGRILGSGAAPFIPMVAGLYKYYHLGSMEDLTIIDPGAPAHIRHHNELMEYFWNNPAPMAEYVFNVFKAPVVSFSLGLRVISQDGVVSEEVQRGDGVVALWSAAGKSGHDQPSILMGLITSPAIT